MGVQIRQAELRDLLVYKEHADRHHLESGNSGDLIFAPFEKARVRSWEEFRVEAEEKLGRPLTEPGWERLWLAFDGERVVGAVKLVQSVPIPASLHRTTLQMGIERGYRGQNVGSNLIEAALKWAEEETKLEWIQLQVFEHNQPARALYKKFGFREVGMVVDQFRVYGQKINDITMVLPLER